MSLTWIRPPVGDERCRVDAERPAPTFSLSASSALTAAMRTAGLTAAAVVLPPEPPLIGNIVSPISGRIALDRQAERIGGDHRDQRAGAGAEILRAAPDDDAAVGGRSRSAPATVRGRRRPRC